MSRVTKCHQCEHEITASTDAGAVVVVCPSCGASNTIVDDLAAEESGVTMEFSGRVPPVTPHGLENDLTLEAPRRTEPAGNTWDDSERMQRLLADIEAQPADDYLPVVREPNTSPYDETIADTSRYESEPEPEPAADPAWANTAELDTSGTLTAASGRKKRRGPSLVKTLVGIVAAGIIGLALGGYALLWLRGPQGDILKVAQYLPPSLLPASFHQAEAKSGPASPNQTTPNQDEAAPIAATAAPPVATDSAKTSPIEPLRINDPAVKPAAATASMAPIVRDAPTYTIAQLSEALLGARDAQAGLQSGDLNDRAVQRTKGLSYEKLCGVAEMATFAEGVDGDATASAVDWVFRTTLAEPRVRGEVARIVPIWIGSTYRRHGGIFFAGAVVERNNAGSMIECRVDAGAGTSLVILVPPSLADTLANSYRPVAVVGSLVDRPAERVSGYTGSAPQAVWVGRLIPLSN